MITDDSDVEGLERFFVNTACLLLPPTPRKTVWSSPILNRPGCSYVSRRLKCPKRRGNSKPRIGDSGILRR